MSYQHLLVAVDGSPTADPAVNEATGLAQATGGHAFACARRARPCCAALRSAWRKAACRWTPC